VAPSQVVTDQLAAEGDCQPICSVAKSYMASQSAPPVPLCPNNCHGRRLASKLCHLIVGCKWAVYWNSCLTARCRTFLSHPSPTSDMEFRAGALPSKAAIFIFNLHLGREDQDWPSTVDTKSLCWGVLEFLSEVHVSKLDNWLRNHAPRTSNSRLPQVWNIARDACGASRIGQRNTQEVEPYCPRLIP
jgi:hypothetical protein